MSSLSVYRVACPYSTRRETIVPIEIDSQEADGRLCDGKVAARELGGRPAPIRKHFFFAICDFPLDTRGASN